MVPPRRHSSDVPVVVTHRDLVAWVQIILTIIVGFTIIWACLDNIFSSNVRYRMRTDTNSEEIRDLIEGQKEINMSINELVLKQSRTLDQMDRLTQTLEDLTGTKRLWYDGKVPEDAEL